MNMKKIFKSLLLIASVAIAISCADESLDPLNMNKVKKGSILALRGTQLQNIYFEGKPGYEFFPKIYTGTEKFEFDAEYLAEDPSTLESMDIYAIKRTPSGTGFTQSRVLLRNVPFSEFKETDDYVNPWVSVSFDVSFLLDKLGVSLPADAQSFISTYQFGLNIETDLNLTDGSIVPATDIVAAGLFQSNQFYPAQKLTMAVTDYCSYDAVSWLGVYDATETSEFFGAYGPYDVTLTADGATANRFRTTNWYDSGIPIYFDLTPSVDVETQVVTVPAQPNPNNTARTIAGTGTYNQCLNEITINMTYTQGTTVLDALIWKLKKQ